MFKNDIIEEIENLAAFELNKGVSPFDLMLNIIDEEYKEISIKKQNDLYVCDVKFTEQDDNDNLIKLTYRYIYDFNMVLMKIIVINNKNVNVAWTREFEEKKLLSEVLKKIDKHEDKKDFYDSLPQNLKYLITKKDNIIII